nr:uncharacterized protein CI109_006180 [Kwoniella shandongensis]KAA5525489.1 hypothetical protein CI109_006180 [Kwoniella shandongensis]
MQSNSVNMKPLLFTPNREWTANDTASSLADTTFHWDREDIEEKTRPGRQANITEQYLSIPLNKITDTDVSGTISSSDPSDVTPLNVQGKLHCSMTIPNLLSETSGASCNRETRIEREAYAIEEEANRRRADDYDLSHDDAIESVLAEFEAGTLKLDPNTVFPKHPLIQANIASKIDRVAFTMKLAEDFSLLEAFWKQECDPQAGTISVYKGDKLTTQTHNQSTHFRVTYIPATLKFKHHVKNEEKMRLLLDKTFGGDGQQVRGDVSWGIELEDPELLGAHRRDRFRRH